MSNNPAVMAINTCCCLFVVLLLTACGSTAVPELPANAYQDPWLDARYDDDRDPLEGFNRANFRFNFNVMDQYALRPVAAGWIYTLPDAGRQGMSNFLANLEEPVSAINNLLQLKVIDAAGSIWRFGVNSTVGLLGIFDVAALGGVERRNEDFDEVLGYYGVGTGPYLMLPIYGVATPRSLVGDTVDGLFSPFTFWQNALKWSVKGVEKRAEFMAQEGVMFNALDPYAFSRNAYFEYIEFQVYDGQPPLAKGNEHLDDYLDEIDD